MLVLYLLFGMEILNFSMTIPVFGRHIFHMGGTQFFMGLLGSLSALISLIWKPMAGSLSDTKGRKRVLLWCLVLSLIGNILTYMSTSLNLLLAGRLLCAFGSPVQILLRTIIADQKISNEQKADFFNRLGAIFPVCFMGGTLFGGYISDYKNGFSYIFLIIITSVLISIGLLNFLPDHIIPKKNEKSEVTLLKTAKKEFKLAINNLKLIKWDKYWNIFAIKGTLDFSFGIIQSNFSFIFHVYFNLEGMQTGYVFLLFGTSSMITNILMSTIKKTFYSQDQGRLRLLHGCIMLTLVYTGLGLSSVFSVFLCFMGLMSMAGAFLDSTLNEVLISKSDGSDKAIVLSSFDNMQSVAQLFAPLLSGVIADAYGQRIAMLTCPLPTLIGTIIALRSKI